MKITFTGAQGTGKTTLVNRLSEKDNLQDYEFVRNISRQIASQGYNINENGDDRTQLKIAETLQEISLKPNFFSERCIVDCMVYSYYLYYKNKINLFTLESIIDTYERIVPCYDYIFYLKPEFQLEDDGVRSVNKEFVDFIIHTFEEVIEQVKSLNNNTYQLTGTVEERLNQIGRITGLF